MALDARQILLAGDDIIRMAGGASGALLQAALVIDCALVLIMACGAGQVAVVG